MTPKKRPKPTKKSFHVKLDESEQRDLRKCTRLKLDDPHSDFCASPRAVMGWALRKCAAEVREG